MRTEDAKELAMEVVSIKRAIKKAKLPMLKELLKNAMEQKVSSLKGSEGYSKGDFKSFCAQIKKGSLVDKELDSLSYKYIEELSNVITEEVRKVKESELKSSKKEREQKEEKELRDYLAKNTIRLVNELNEKNVAPSVKRFSATNKIDSGETFFCKNGGSGRWQGKIYKERSGRTLRVYKSMQSIETGYLEYDGESKELRSSGEGLIYLKSVTAESKIVVFRDAPKFFERVAGAYGNEYSDPISFILVQNIESSVLEMQELNGILEAKKGITVEVE